jgi:hypothetical protein
MAGAVVKRGGCTMARLQWIAAGLVAPAVLGFALLGLTAGPATADVAAFTLNRTALLTGNGPNTSAVVSGTVSSTDSAVRISVVVIQSQGASEEGGAVGVVHVGSVTLPASGTPTPWALVTIPSTTNLPARSLLPGQAQIGIMVESFDAGGNRVDRRQGSGVIRLVRDIRTAGARESSGRPACWIEAKQRGPARPV